jgi:hypothetical protein
MPQHSEFCYTFSRIFHQYLSLFPMHSVCFRHPMMKEHLQFIRFSRHVCFQHKLELQIMTSTFVHGNCDGACVIKSLKKHVLNGVHCDQHGYCINIWHKT